jgi:uncharacterized protein YbjT (DUF2867 family)
MHYLSPVAFYLSPSNLTIISRLSMGKVAIAGASGTVAQHIIKAILLRGKHSIVALTRSPNEHLSKSSKITVKIVDYDNHGSLVSALEGCDTVISTIFNRDDEVGALGTNQLNLLSAAKEAGVRRFAPSDFGMSMDAVKILQRQKNKEPILEALKTSGMEYTRFQNGIFMNYFSSGSPNQSEGLSGLNPMSMLLDMTHGTAKIPGDGNVNVTTTDVRDVGRFVAASLDLEKWEHESGMSGSTFTFNQLLGVAEKVMGKTFDKTYIPVETLEEMSKQPGRMGFLGQAMLVQAIGYAEVKPRLNELCPDVKPTGIEEFLQKYWSI